MRTHYPEITPFNVGMLDVGSGHSVYFEESGNARGQAMVFVHGGPGGGTDAKMRQFFDPSHYRIVLFDQRGCGKSTPHASLEANTTWDLISDMEKIRTHLAIEKWSVFGGSWGSTLALAYAEKHPERVLNLVLRGIFMLRPKELHWFYQQGASELFPEAFDEYRSLIPVAEQHDLMAAYHRRLTDADRNVQIAAARAWSKWEMATSYLTPKAEAIARATEDDAFSLAFARIESHYFHHKGFFRSENQLLEDAHKLASIPTVIVQGRYDVVCPPVSAWDLSKAMPHAKLIWTLAGHASYEPETLHQLVECADAARI